MTRNTGTRAIVAKRAADPPVDTAEIRALASAAGYDVVGDATQIRNEDPGTHFGRGKVEELAVRVTETGASLLVVDGELTPRQTVELREAMPADTDVFDRYRLILAIFADQASSRRAQLQVERARLRYELPRLEEDPDVQGMNKFTEKGTPIDGVKNQIADLERKLADLPSPAEQYREQRRRQGFDLVTVAGYTNAGKSTLLHRIADDLNLDESEPDHPDRDATAEIGDRLFKTLETTTRRATLDGRPVLFTDTVGFVQDLPHWLVESFSETLSEAAAADAVVLVVDASDPVEELREKLTVSIDVLDSQGVDAADVVTAVNKVDLLDDTDRAERLRAVEESAPSPVPVSVTEGMNVDRLVDEVTERLPTDGLELTIPNCDEAMQLVSQAYDRATVDDVTYSGETVAIDVRGRPDVVAKLEAEAAEIADG